MQLSAHAGADMRAHAPRARPVHACCIGAYGRPCLLHCPYTLQTPAPPALDAPGQKPDSTESLIAHVLREIEKSMLRTVPSPSMLYPQGA